MFETIFTYIHIVFAFHDLFFNLVLCPFRFLKPMTFADCIGDGIQFYLTFFTCFSYPVNYKFDCLPFKFIQSQELYLTDSMINFTLYYGSYFSCMLVSKPKPILNML